MSRPTVTVIGADGSASSNTVTLPNVFKAPIRADIVQYENTAHEEENEDRWANNRTGRSTPAWLRTSASRTL